MDEPLSPINELSAFVVRRNYVDLGCDRWNSRKVFELMAKFGDTRPVMAARLRLPPRHFEKRLKTGAWTKQDGLILTMLEREIDFQKGEQTPKGKLFEVAI